MRTSACEKTETFLVLRIFPKTQLNPASLILQNGKLRNMKIDGQTHHLLWLKKLS